MVGGEQSINNFGLRLGEHLGEADDPIEGECIGERTILLVSHERVNAPAHFLDMLGKVDSVLRPRSVALGLSLARALLLLDLPFGHDVFGQSQTSLPGVFSPGRSSRT